MVPYVGGCRLTKIPRIPVQFTQSSRAVVHTLRDHMGDAGSPLQRAFDHEPARFERTAALRREYLGSENDIEYAGFIFQ